jgi:hypothetical protein
MSGNTAPQACLPLISEGYCLLNAELHKTSAHYGTSGRRYSQQVYDLALSMQTQDILDYGCGKSTLAAKLPFEIKQYDPAVEKFSAPPSPADLVVCTDVLEHVEPERLDAVLGHLETLVKRVGFFVIATRPAKKTLGDGRNAHLIIEDAKWWLDVLWDRFKVTRFENSGESFLVIAGAKN